MEKTLLHTCCAPCSIVCIDQLREDGIEPVSYWNNPNIPPWPEYRQRRDAWMAYTKSVGVNFITSLFISQQTHLSVYRYTS